MTLRFNQPHDIHIETVPLEIMVVDSATRRAIPRAAVTMTLFLDTTNEPLVNDL